MSQTNVNQVLWENLIQTSSADKISNIIFGSLSNCSKEEVLNLLNIIIKINVSNDKLKPIIDSLESIYIGGCDVDIAPYLAVLYARAENKSLSKYYMGLSDSISDIVADELSAIVNEFEDEPYYDINKNIISNYDFKTEYDYCGERKSYSVYSFSKNIGKNATVLKTDYGAILFDCGASCGQQNTDIITEIELLEFFKSINISPDDLIAVIISHAHLDHYGSISTLINLGIDISKIYIEDYTKSLISQVDTDLPSIENSFPISAFFYPFQKVKITAFDNGHILGSCGYIVTFDERNIIYTGDFCIHDQNTVPGLNVRKLLQNKVIDMYGVDCLITETTYGKRTAPIAYNDVSIIFQHFVNLLISNGFKVFIPSFAIGRSQEIALLLNDSKSVLIDGLAAKISKIYENISGIKIFNNNTRYNEIVEDNKEDNFDCNDIIIASSGMLSKDSTSYNYVKNFLSSDRKIGIIKTGYISSESYGNDLLNLWKGKNCRLFDISLSAHADYNEIISLIEALEPNHIVCIHGDGLKESKIHFEEINNKKTEYKNNSAVGDNNVINLEEKNNMLSNEVSKSITCGEINQNIDLTDINDDKTKFAPSSLLDIIQELKSNDSSFVLELIKNFITRYDNVPKTAKMNINKNPAVVSAYYELYCYVRMNLNFRLLYEALKNTGPQKSKQVKFLKKIMNLFSYDGEIIAVEESEAFSPVSKSDSSTVEEIPIWNCYDDLYIYNGKCNCISSQDIIKEEVFMLTIKGERIVPSAKVVIDYCRDCNKFYINYKDYVNAIKKYKVLIAKYNVDNEIENKFDKSRSFTINPLFISGYCLETSNDGLKSSIRQTLIKEIISNHLMSKDDVINALSEFKKKESEFTNRFQINDDIRYVNSLQG